MLRDTQIFTNKDDRLVYLSYSLRKHVLQGKLRAALNSRVYSYKGGGGTRLEKKH